MSPLLDPRWAVVLKVADLGSLTRAAVALDMPQPTVSRHVAELERECRLRLFRRTGRGVVLTEAGARFLPQIRQLALDAERVADAIRSDQGVASGEVRVGLLPSTVPMLAARLFGLVRERHPQVKLHLIEGANAQLEEQIKDGRIDMGLLLREGAKADPGEAVLTKSRLQLVGVKGDPRLASGSIDLARLQGLPLVVPSRPHPLRVRLEAIARERQLELDFAVNADSIRLQHEIAATGAAYAISSGLFELQRDPRFACAEIVRPQLLRSIVLANTLRRPHTLATREVERIMVAVVPQLLKA